MRNSRVALLTALGVDNFGSGLFLPVALLYVTVPGVIAPALVALFSVALWLPWLLAGVCAGLAMMVLRWLSGRLPAHALRPAIGAGLPPSERERR